MYQWKHMGYVVPKRDRHAKQEPHQHSNSLKKSLTVVLMLLRKLSGWLNLNCTSGMNLLLEASQAGCAPSSKVSKRRT